MARAKRDNTWKNLSIQIDENLYNRLKKEAETESRTLTATVELILRNYFTNKDKTNKF